MSDSPRPPRRRWKNVPLVRERDDLHARRLWRWLLLIVVAFAPIVVYQLQQIGSVELGYRIESLRQEQQRLSEEERRLRVERATLQSLGTVERLARRELGLVRPATESFVVVRSSRSPDNLIALGVPERPGTRR